MSLRNISRRARWSAREPTRAPSCSVPAKHHRRHEHKRYHDVPQLDQHNNEQCDTQGVKERAADAVVTPVTAVAGHSVLVS